MRVRVLLVALSLAVAACSGGDEPEEDAGVGTAGEAVDAWLAGLATMDFGAIEAVTAPVDVALVAAAENAFTTEHLAAVAGSGLPPATLRSYWQTFGAEMVAMLGASPDTLTVGEGDVIEHAGIEFARVPVGPGNDAAGIVARRGEDGWVVDMTATAGPALALQLRRIIATLDDEAEPDVASLYATHAVESLGAALSMDPDNRALELELEAIEDLGLT